METSSSSFRSLFAESAMEAEWELFESEILRDITDSQFAFQVTLERIEVRTEQYVHSFFFTSARSDRTFSLLC